MFVEHLPLALELELDGDKVVVQRSVALAHAADVDVGVLAAVRRIGDERVLVVALVDAQLADDELAASHALLDALARPMRLVEVAS